MHEGHRKRIRDRFIREGLDHFEDHNLLEFLLFYAIPRRDTNETAHKLMNYFGSLSAVFDAPIEEIMRVGKLSENSAVLIKMIPPLCRRYMISRMSSDECLNSTEKAGKYLIPRFFGRRDEAVYLVSLDAKCKVLGCNLLFEGSVNSAHVSIRKIVETALSFNATSVILAHNHTSGIALPSRDDEITTLKIRDALAVVGINLMDHIIVADDDFVSMANNGTLSGRNTLSPGR